MWYWARLLDMESGVEEEHIVEATNRGVGFPIDAPIETSPLYGGDDAAFVIYDIVRDSPDACWVAKVDYY